MARCLTLDGGFDREAFLFLLTQRFLDGPTIRIAAGGLLGSKALGFAAGGLLGSKALGFGIGRASCRGRVEISVVAA
ncbi:MAG TPA: hypothetical protein DCY47_10740, partial [Candidatus Accumulibacter sp.]|nr:hypothetical protein [Accumulibacter sp.]